MPALSDTLKEYFESAVQKDVTPDEILWDVTIGPGEGGQPTAFIFFWMKAALINQLLSFTMVIANPPLVKQEDVDRLVAQAVEAMRKQRTEQLNQGAIEVPGAPYTGGEV